MDKGNSEGKNIHFESILSKTITAWCLRLLYILYIFVFSFCYSMHQNKMQVELDADFICIVWHLFCPFVCLCSVPLLYFFLLLVVFFFFSTPLFILLLCLTLGPYCPFSICQFSLPLSVRLFLLVRSYAWDDRSVEPEQDKGQQQAWLISRSILLFHLLCNEYL